MNCLTFIEITALGVAVCTSVLHRAFWPYGVWVLFFLLCSYMVYRFFPVKQMIPVKTSRSIINIIIFIGFILVYLFLFRS